MDLRSLTSSNKLLYVLVASISLLVFLTVVLILRGLGSGGSGQRITLEMWGVFDTVDAYSAIIRRFENTHPNIRVVYRQFTYEDYERQLVDALASGAGPDIALIHHTWLPKHRDKLIPMPEGKLPGYDRPLMTIRDFREQFVEVAYNDLVVDNRIYAMPMYVDTLALFYNRDLFNSAGLSSPPQTWNGFNDAVVALTKQDASGNITQSGAAIGTARNINRSTDILMAFMLQSGVRMVDPEQGTATLTRSVDNQNVGEVAVQYYTDFANPNKQTYCWNVSQHYSVDAFVEGSTAMMFNYSHQVDIIKQKAPRFNFAVAAMPQLSDQTVTYANYWAPAVTNNASDSNAAWEFIAFATSYEPVLDYLTATHRPSARRDIIELQKDDPDFGVFATQALTAKSWYQADNVAIEGIFADLIEKIVFNERTVRDALLEAESAIDVLMSRRR